MNRKKRNDDDDRELADLQKLASLTRAVNDPKPLPEGAREALEKEQGKVADRLQEGRDQNG